MSRRRMWLASAAGMLVALAFGRPVPRAVDRWLYPEPYCSSTPRDAPSPEAAVRAWAEDYQHHPRIIRGPYSAGYSGNAYSGIHYAHLVEVTVDAKGPMRFIMIGQVRAGGPWRVLDQGTGP